METFTQNCNLTAVDFLSFFFTVCHNLRLSDHTLQAKVTENIKQLAAILFVLSNVCVQQPKPTINCQNDKRMQIWRNFCY